MKTPLLAILLLALLTPAHAALENPHIGWILKNVPEQTQPAPQTAAPAQAAQTPSPQTPVSHAGTTKILEILQEEIPNPNIPIGWMIGITIGLCLFILIIGSSLRGPSESALVTLICALMAAPMIFAAQGDLTRGTKAAANLREEFQKALANPNAYLTDVKVIQGKTSALLVVPAKTREETRNILGKETTVEIVESPEVILPMGSGLIEALSSANVQLAGIPLSDLLIAATSK